MSDAEFEDGDYINNSITSEEFSSWDETSDTASDEDDPEDIDILAKKFVERNLGLVNMEMSSTKTKKNAQLNEWSLGRLKEEGLVLTDLKATTLESYLNGQKVELIWSSKREFPYHCFNIGSFVTLSRKHPLRENPIRAIVLLREKNRLLVMIVKPPTDLGQGTWRLDAGICLAHYERMISALTALAKPLTSPSIPTSHSFSPGHTHNGGTEKLGTVLRDVIVSKTPKVFAAIPSMILQNHPRLKDWVEGDSDATQIVPPVGNDHGLNQSQLNAVKLSLQNRFSLIQGPPGTGKTKTIAQIVRIVNALTNEKVSILVCSKTNVAVDNMLEALLELNLNAVRVGVPARVRPSLRRATLDFRVKNKFGIIKNKDQRYLLQQDILEEADVVCATCISAESRAIAGKQFQLVLIDEGSQCTVPETLVPLLKGCQHAILIGDHKQLPPFVSVKEAGEQGLNISLFERMIKKGVPSTMLNTQYRMHPYTSEFPNVQFYRGRIQDGITKVDRPVPALFEFGGSTQGNAPAVFIIDTRSGEELRGLNRSISNKAEVLNAVSVILSLCNLNRTIKATDIGLVTPYAFQRHLLWESMHDCKFPMDESNYNNVEYMQNRLPEVNTIDGFQGREKDVVLFSAVRTSRSRKIGFMSDVRRINVALTRAKRMLVVIGDLKTLSRDEGWRDFVQWAKDSPDKAIIVDGRSYMPSTSDGYREPNVQTAAPMHATSAPVNPPAAPGSSASNKKARRKILRKRIRKIKEEMALITQNGQGNTNQLGNLMARLTLAEHELNNLEPNPAVNNQPLAAIKALENEWKRIIKMENSNEKKRRALTTQINTAKEKLGKMIKHHGGVPAQYMGPTSAKKMSGKCTKRRRRIRELDYETGCIIRNNGGGAEELKRLKNKRETCKKDLLEITRLRENRIMIQVGSVPTQSGKIACEPLHKTITNLENKRKLIIQNEGNNVKELGDLLDKIAAIKM